MSTPIRVLYLDHTARLSGAEIALFRFLQAFDPARVKPIVLLGEDGPLVGKLRDIGIDTRVRELDPRVRNVRKGTLGVGGLRHLRLLAMLVRYGRDVSGFASECGAQLVHCNSLKSDIYGAIAARGARVPLLWHVHDRVERPYLPGPAVWVFRVLARAVPSYVVSSTHSTLTCLRLPADKPRDVVPYGLPEELMEWVPTRNATRSCDKASCPRIGIVGRIAPWKGQHVFLDALVRLVREGRSVRGAIIGDALFGEASYKSKLVHQADNPLLTDLVEFRGFRDNVMEELATLDILVHCSVSPEPFGQVITEGMAMGLPVIAADAGGPREIITHGVNGLLAPPGDGQALADAITRLLDDPGEAARLAAAGRAHARANFSAKTMAAKMEQVYREVLDRQDGARSR